MNTIAEINAHKEKMKSLVEDLWYTVKNKNLPLEKRWEAYTNIPEGFSSEGWTQHYELNDREICWYDDFYIERYESVDNVNIIEKIEDDPERFANDFDFEEEELDDILTKLKEQMMESGVRYWKEDW